MLATAKAAAGETRRRNLGTTSAFPWRHGYISKIITTNSLVFFREMIRVNSENHAKHWAGKKQSGTYCNHCALKGSLMNTRDSIPNRSMHFSICHLVWDPSGLMACGFFEPYHRV
jgi:hypothetical protein